jgi:hypothetical protein
MKRSMAAAVAAIFVVLLIWSGVRGRREGAPPGSPVVATGSAAEDGPTGRVRAMLAAGRDGDLTAYLDAFTGDLRDRVAREADEKGHQEFRSALRGAAAARSSVAVFAAEPDGPDGARVVVESVYPDRNERQTYHLVRTDGDAAAAGGWRVADVEMARGAEPAVRVGSYASFNGPDGPPVEIEGGTGTGPAPDGIVPSGR